MGYYTVIAKSDRTGDTRKFTGIKANSGWAAVQAIVSKLDRPNKWSYDFYLSKRRPRRYKHAKHTNKLRSPWAVLAKNSKHQHFNVLNRWSNLHYHRLTYLAWRDDCFKLDNNLVRLPVMDKLEDLFRDMRPASNPVADLNEAIYAHYESEAPKD